METVVEQSGIPHPSFQECWSTSLMTPRFTSSLCVLHLGFGLPLSGPGQFDRAVSHAPTSGIAGAFENVTLQFNDPGSMENVHCFVRRGLGLVYVQIGA